MCSEPCSGKATKLPAPRAVLGPRRSRKSVFAALLVLMACTFPGCQTVDKTGSLLGNLQAWSLPGPLNHPSPPYELAREKAVMRTWLERYLHGRYRVVDQRFVLSGPDFTKWAALESQAGQYMEQELGATYLRQDGSEFDRMEQEWPEAAANRISFWRLDGDSPRYFALLMTREPLPGHDERKLVGYFELAPATR